MFGYKGAWGVLYLVIYLRGHCGLEEKTGKAGKAGVKQTWGAKEIRVCLWLVVPSQQGDGTVGTIIKWVTEYP